MSEQQTRDRRPPQSKVGTVVSDKMDKTVVVAVSNARMHPLYHRQVKRTAKFYAHDEGNEARVGDRVQIVASRPLSAKKRWRLGRILQRAKG